MLKTKKFLSVLIALIMAVSCFSLLAINVFAANEAAPTATCTHLWGPLETTVQMGTGTYVSEEICNQVQQTTRTCQKCLIMETVRVDSVRSAHKKDPLSASCNGKMQTLKRQCPYCLHVFTETNSCPAGPHTGLCPALPF